MTNELAIGQGLPQSKAEIEVYNANVKTLALSGEVDIIKLARTVNIMKRIVENFEKENDIQSALLNEVEKYGKGELKEVSVRETGTKYYYSECNHAEYNLLLQQKAEIDARLKQIEETMKTGVVDGITGEILVQQAPKSSTTKVVFTIK